jgi:hypothetical protein
MAEPESKAAPAGSGPAGPIKPERPPNPVWRMMGTLCTTIDEVPSDITQACQISASSSLRAIG